MQVVEPADLAAMLERGVPLPAGPGHRLAGYVVAGVSFASGDVLVLRRFPVSSAGPGYTAVWHCSPAGRWTVYADVPRHQGCMPYFAPAVDEFVVAPIRVEWNNRRSLSVAVDDGRVLAWSLLLRPTAATRLFNLMARWLAPLLQRRPALLTPLALVTRVLLGVGPLRFAGRTPSGARFQGQPLALWVVDTSRAIIAGHDAGPSGRLQRPLALGDLAIARRGLFAGEQTSMLETAG